ncbi:MAG: phosphoenolpyruvate carboxykinase (GTP) [Armatimonadetes bacterium]|nr:phosphoenolpyruvate carboxykinase (GTP) [Armatimonadota bacterium]
MELPVRVKESYEVNNEKLGRWIRDVAEMCQPDAIRWCDGSPGEYDRLMSDMVRRGTATPLAKRPNSFLFRSDPSDVARVEDRTFISCITYDEVGPTNNWINCDDLRRTMTELYRGCMHGRTMYVIPFSMGPLNSPMAKISIQVTDSPYVVCSMHIMTRVSPKVLEALGADGDFIKCLHSVGAPLAPGEEDALWPCAPIEQKYISHFPHDDEIWSYGSGYGGNALLGKKSLGLRIASAMARREGWMAEHMLILELELPGGELHYVAAAFPSACGKTNLAMLVSPLEHKGYKVRTIGDDIAWLRPGPDGRLWAVNPEAGFFGVVPGTGPETNPNAMATIRTNTIFTNVAVTRDGIPWWEGKDKKPPKDLLDWQGRPWNGTDKAAHPNSRFTVQARQCPSISPKWEDPQGVPLSALVFGGRRARLAPLVFEARDWEHGVFVAATMGSETTAAATGNVGVVRRDPMAMLPFCGYNMGDYFGHWLRMGQALESPPRIFHVNWFRQGQDGRFLWPGFGQNLRVLLWMIDRIKGKAGAVDTPIGKVPRPEDLNLEGLNVPDSDMKALLAVDREEWAAEVPEIRAFFDRFGERLPPPLSHSLDALAQRLGVTATA